MRKDCYSVIFWLAYDRELLLDFGKLFISFICEV